MVLKSRRLLASTYEKKKFEQNFHVETAWKVAICKCEEMGG